MAKEKINLKELTALTKKLYHAYYAGNLELWFSYLGPESIYLGTGGPMLFGSDAIQEHFKDFNGKELTMVQEEYYPISMGDTAAQVCGLNVLESRASQFRVYGQFTIAWRIISGRLKIVHQHNSYEYMQHENSDALKANVNTLHFARSLLMEYPAKQRMMVQSGTQTIFINPYTIMYVQSQRNRSELVCIDRVISCSTPIGKMAKELPDTFYPLHRSYLVNTLYLVAVRRFEAELISGITLPIPAMTYKKAKEDLIKLIRKN